MAPALSAKSKKRRKALVGRRRLGQPVLQYIKPVGDDPPPHRLYHDGKQFDPDDITPVTPALSAFLRVAEVRPLTDAEAEALMFPDASPGAAFDDASGTACGITPRQISYNRRPRVKS